MESNIISPGAVTVELGEFRLIPGPGGSAGERGPRGYGIESAVLNPDYTLTLNFEDGSSYTTPSIRGADGVGISKIEVIPGEDYDESPYDTLRVTLTDGKVEDFPIYNGAVAYCRKATEDAMAELTVDIDGIRMLAEKTQNSAEALENRVGALEVTSEGIEAMVERTVVDKVTGAVEEARSELELEAGRISAQVESLESTAESLESRTTTLEATVEGLDVNVEQVVADKVADAVKSATAEFDVKLDGVTQRVTSAEEDAQSLTTRVGSLETTLEGIDATVERTVEDKLAGAMAAAKGELKVTTDAISGQVSSMREDAQSLEERVGQMETTLEGFDASVEEKIEDKVTGAVESAKAQLQEQVSGLEASITAKVENRIEDTISGVVESATAGITERVDGLEAGIDATVESAVEDKMTGAIEAAKGEIKLTTDAITGEVNSVKEDAQALESRVGQVETTLEGFGATVESTVTDKVTGAIEAAKGELTVTTDAITQRVESLEETSGELETKTAQIGTTVEGITMDVTQSAGADGQVTAKITLKVGPNSYSGFIKMDGNLQVSGQLSADALYAALGDIADLAVNKFSTSRRIVKYLARDETDDNYVRAQEQFLEFVTGVKQEGTEQAVNPSGLPLYWEDDPEGASLGADGYPYKDGERIFITTGQTDWPVTVYTYKDYVMRSIAFEGKDGIYSVVDVFGTGDGSGGSQGRMQKTTNGLKLTYTTSAMSGKKELGLEATDEGYLDLYGLRKTTSLDFSGWDEGYFVETVDAGKDAATPSSTYSVTFDEQQRPTKITDGTGHVTTVKW